MNTTHESITRDIVAMVTAQSEDRAYNVSLKPESIVVSDKFATVGLTWTDHSADKPVSFSPPRWLDVSMVSGMATDEQKLLFGSYEKTRVEDAALRMATHQKAFSLESFKFVVNLGVINAAVLVLEIL